jgi:exosortase D (VPLPA-CTERM-specific)
MKAQTLTKYALPGLLAVIYLSAFWPACQKLAIRWNSGDNSYCYLIVPLFLYLCWEKKSEFCFDQFSWNLWGFVPLGFSILLMMVGELGSLEFILFMGIWGCIVGMMFIFYGMRVRHLIFPLIILAFMVPLPPFVNQLLTFNLKLAASSLSVMMLRLTGVSVLQDGNVIDLGVAQLQMVDACSGLRYFVPLILLALLSGYLVCRRWWQSVVLLALVPPLSVLINSLRIFVTGRLYVSGHPELAQNLLHDFAGLAMFIMGGIFLFMFSKALRRLDSRPLPKMLVDSGGPQLPPRLVGSATVILCLLLVGSGLAFRNLPSAANLPGRESFNSFPMVIGQWQAKRHYLSREVLDSLWADDYISATYSRKDLVNTIYLLIPFYEYQGTRHTAHAPQSCMLGSGWAMSDSNELVVRTETGHEFTCMATIWKKGDTRVLGSYFFFQRGRIISSPWMNKYWLMVDALTKQRTDGALVRAELTMAPHQSLDEAYRLLEMFMGQVYEILPAYVPT